MQWRSQPDNLVMLCKSFRVYRLKKESISKEMNNDNDLNLHSMTKLSGWLRYCFSVFSHKCYSSSIHYSTSALNKSSHLLEIFKIVLCWRKQRNDFKENINHPSIDKATFYIFLPIFTLLFPTQQYFEYFQRRGGGGGECMTASV